MTIAEAVATIQSAARSLTAFTRTQGPGRAWADFERIVRRCLSDVWAPMLRDHVTGMRKATFAEAAKLGCASCAKYGRPALIQATLLAEDEAREPAYLHYLPEVDAGFIPCAVPRLWVRFDAEFA